MAYELVNFQVVEGLSIEEGVEVCYLEAVEGCSRLVRLRTDRCLDQASCFPLRSLLLHNRLRSCLRIVGSRVIQVRHSLGRRSVVVQRKVGELRWDVIGAHCSCIDTTASLLGDFGERSL